MMNSDGTDKLRDNLLSQQERLIQQLEDLEEVKADLDNAEYEETKKETLDQIFDTAASLQKITSGNLSLTDEMTSKRKLTRDAIRSAFRTPEVIKMFARREPEQLKQRLKERERDFKLGKLNSTIFNQEKRELLVALQHLGEQLSCEQECFLSQDQVDKGCHFERVSENTDNSSNVLQWVKNDLKQ